jgi:hypothetical protein
MSPAVALTLARGAAIDRPPFSLQQIDGKPALIVRRFDRRQTRRVAYLSAMSMLEQTDGQGGDYIDIAESIEETSPNATQDLHELWRRIVFTMLISNTDDHLRNHGFLRHSTAGWTISPVFDVNPNPEPGKNASAPRSTATTRGAFNGRWTPPTSSAPRPAKPRRSSDMSRRPPASGAPSRVEKASPGRPATRWHRRLSTPVPTTHGGSLRAGDARLLVHEDVLLALVMRRSP